MFIVHVGLGECVKEKILLPFLLLVTAFDFFHMIVMSFSISLFLTFFNFYFILIHFCLL